MNFTIYNSLILLGVIQGFIFGAIVLLSKKFKSRSTYYLIALIIGFSYNNLQFYLSDAGFITGHQMYRYFYIPMASLYPVFIWFYVQTFLYPEKRFPGRMKLLYAPFTFFFLVTLIFKMGYFLDQDFHRHYGFFKGIIDFQSVFAFLFTIILLAWAYSGVLRFEKGEREWDQKGVRMQLGWLRTTLIILFVLSLFWAFALYKYLSNSQYRYLFTILWVAISVVIYWLGHMGIYKYGILKERSKIRSYSKDQRFTASQKHQNKHISALEHLLVNQKKFQDPNLSLEMVSELLQISKGHLSRIINTELHTSFSEYINSLRVEEAKSYLINPVFSKYTLAAIGLEAGFNSKSVFNSAFKKATKLTPSQYRRDHMNSS